jgi:murein DD-endopeptidase MepM/ murein hydrolase activator NlpD
MRFDLLSRLAREQGRLPSSAAQERRTRRAWVSLALLSGFVIAVIPVAVFGVMSGPKAPPAVSLSAPAANNLPDVPSFAPSQPASRAGEITTTIRRALAQADLPGDISQQITRLLGKTLDLSARSQPGDYFRVVYEPVDADVSEQKLRVTALEVRFRGKHHSGVWFATKARPQGAYYRFDGTLMHGLRFAMPVEPTRISSSFGGRVHPVSGVRHTHSGVDLAAPAGRAVYASADGVVSHIGNEPGGYGKYVVIRHPNGYLSYYAHLSRIERGLRKGMRIVRAQRVGAVGSTGTATGPHLHFEVKQGNRPIDPLAVIRKTNAPALRGQQLAAFKRAAGVARTQLRAAGPASLTAARGIQVEAEVG